MESFQKNEQIQVEFQSQIAKTIKIIEINKDILQYLESEIAPIELKSSSVNNDVVLCTSNKTFNLKKVETSNSVYLFRPNRSSGPSVMKVEASCAVYYEIRPKLLQLSQSIGLIRRLVESEPNIDTSQLYESVNLSRDETEQILASSGVIALPSNQVKLLAFKPFLASIDAVFQYLITSRIWPTDINLSQLISHLSEIDRDIITFFISNCGASLITNPLHWTIEVNRLIRINTLSLFIKSKKKMILKDKLFDELYLTTPGLESSQTASNLLLGLKGLVEEENQSNQSFLRILPELNDDSCKIANFLRYIAQSECI